MADQIYKVRDPSGAIREISGPAGATDDQVIAKAQELFGGAPKRDVASEIANDPISQGARESAKPTFGEELSRQALLTGRYGMEGIGLGPIANKMGLPQPQGGFERIVGDTARTMAGTAGIASAARQASTMLQGIPQKIAEALAAAPGSQIASAAGAGAGAGVARESGAGPTGQMVAALAGGMAVPLVQNAGSALARGVRNVADPWMPGGIDRTVARTANLAAGDKRGEIIKALRNADDFVGAPVTAGEAASKVGSAEFSGLQEAVKGRFPSAYDAIAQGQNKARVDALRSFGGTPADMKWSAEGRAAVTNPMREEALANANIAGVKVPELQGRIASQTDAVVSALRDKGRFETMAAQQENLAHGGAIPITAGGRGRTSPSAYPVPGEPRIPGRYTENIQRVPEAQAASVDTAQILANRKAQVGLSQFQLDSLAAHGHYPLEAKKVVGAIDSMLAKPGDRAVTLNQKILSAVRDKIASLANKDGVIDSRDLYAIRKSDINDVVATLTKDLDASTKNRAASLVNSVKADIDNAIEGAGGTGWKAYLKTYENMSRPINQMQVGQFLESKLTAPMAEQGAGVPQRAAMYAQALRDAPGTIKRSTGNPRFDDLAQVLTPEQLAVTQNVGKDLARSAEQSRLGRIGIEKARELLGDVSPSLPAAGMFSPHYSVLRAISNRLHGRVEGKSLDALAKAMQDPREMARIMEAATPKEKAILAPYLPTAPIFVGANAMSQGQ